MNKSLKSTIIGVGVAIVTLAFFSTITPRESRAAGIAGGEQYKVISIIPFARNNGPGLKTPALESALNQLGEQGWKVRAFGLNEIILAK